MNSFSTLSILQIILFPILYVFSFLYRALFLLDQKFTKKKKLPGAFVISVGNLSMGGTGKLRFPSFLQN
ncbi:tetraacyldisaccharide-1-P 4'-kinase-like protein [Leptospira interrogans serovar Australis str. 200703203]|uniref:Tetraacyldisaccharide-1-P 4'-kinase-like protein n=1 Tax=Leptospira interrogans serovar Australis str. 200703203 TaxID=1085541 RepID=N1UUE8_LEPIR|nr:tetraacyldisaccharide-1-P 4'-kinase-like protein [Leptospira interrogans serovar Australis str. 200703203]